MNGKGRCGVRGALSLRAGSTDSNGPRPACTGRVGTPIPPETIRLSPVMQPAPACAAHAGPSRGLPPAGRRRRRVRRDVHLAPRPAGPEQHPGGARHLGGRHGAGAAPCAPAGCSTAGRADPVLVPAVLPPSRTPHCPGAGARRPGPRSGRTRCPGPLSRCHDPDVGAQPQELSAGVADRLDGHPGLGPSVTGGGHAETAGTLGASRSRACAFGARTAGDPGRRPAPAVRAKAEVPGRVRTNMPGPPAAAPMSFWGGAGLHRHGDAHTRDSRRGPRL